MPSVLHLANINFESELVGEKHPRETPISLQLQFLPLVYGNKEDGIVVSHLPVNTQGTFHLLSDPKKLDYEKLETWGYSRLAKAWAEKHGLAYPMPSWQTVTEVNSKEFSWKVSPQLPCSSLLRTEKEVEKWIKLFEGPKVLKSCFGVSGRGHLLLPASTTRLKKFLDLEFSRNLPVIGEPWAQRELDFSTQWYIHADQQIEYLGPTLLIVTPHGQYVETRVGKIHIPLLAEHKKVAEGLLKKIASMGYFGNIGIDAMIYGGGQLQPVVEINARKTMGWVALEMQKRRFPKQTIALRYSASLSGENLLPQEIMKANGSIMRFTRKLTLNILDN